MDTYSELEGFDETNGLINRTTNGKIVDCDLSVAKTKTKYVSTPGL